MTRRNFHGKTMWVVEILKISPQNFLQLVQQVIEWEGVSGGGLGRCSVVHHRWSVRDTVICRGLVNEWLSWSFALISILPILVTVMLGIPTLLRKVFLRILETIAWVVL